MAREHYMIFKIASYTYLITRPATTHTGSTKAEYYFLTSSSPGIYQFLIVGILTDRDHVGNVTLFITCILGWIPRIRYRKGDYNMRICIDLFDSGTSLPVTNIRNEPGVFSVVSTVLKSSISWRSREWGRERRIWSTWRRRVVKAGSRLTTIPTMINARATPAILRATHSCKAQTFTCGVCPTLCSSSLTIEVVGACSSRSGSSGSGCSCSNRHRWRSRRLAW